MPISLELVNFIEAFRLRLVKEIAKSFQQLGKWLTKRVKMADDLDRATAHIPRVWFYNDAVTLWIDASQKDALAPEEPPPSFGAHLKAGGQRFVTGLEDVFVLPRESQIIPQFFAPLLDGVNVIDKSVERFHTPTKAMFDTEARTASDLFGLAALAWRALYFSETDLFRFWFRLVILMEPEKEGGPVKSVDALPDLFESVTRYVVSGLLLVPRLPEFVKAVWKEASIFIRIKVLDAFAKIEQQVFGVRRKVIDIFYVDLRNALRRGLVLAAAWGFVSTAWISLFLDLSKTFVKETLDKFGDYLSKLAGFMNKTVKVFYGLEGLLDELSNIDLMQLLLEKLEGKGDLLDLLTDPPVITLGNLATDQGRIAANRRLQRWLTQIQKRAGEVGGIISPLVGIGLETFIKSKLIPVRDILRLTLTRKTVEVEEKGPFSGPLPGFPDISDVFTKWIGPLRKSLEDFVPSLQAQTQGLIDKGTDALDVIGGHFERAAAAALRAPSAAKYLAISNAAEKMAEKAMPSSDVEGGEPNAVLAAIARSWENWFVSSEQGALAGFALLKSIIPEYIAEMRKYWAERLARGEEATVRLPDDLPDDFPTSPHIMALRPVLARTLVPRVTIDARGRALDEALAGRVADAFLNRVQEAHRKGLAKLASFQSAADAADAITV